MGGNNVANDIELRLVNREAIQLFFYFIFLDHNSYFYKLNIKVLSFILFFMLNRLYLNTIH